MSKAGVKFGDRNEKVCGLKLKLHKENDNQFLPNFYFEKKKKCKKESGSDLTWELGWEQGAAMAAGRRAGSFGEGRWQLLKFLLVCEEEGEWGDGWGRRTPLPQPAVTSDHRRKLTFDRNNDTDGRCGAVRGARDEPEWILQLREPISEQEG